MTKAGAGDWKTPLGYYERAIAELRRTREEIQAELQNLKGMQPSLVELPKLKAELDCSQIEIQTLKAELETTKDNLATTQKTANEAQARLENAESTANVLKAELQTIRERTMITEPTTNNDRVSEELSQIKEQLSVMQSLLQQIQQKQSSLESDSHSTVLQYLSTLQSQVSKLSEELSLTSPASGVDYTNLRDLLAEKKWKEADRETCTYMLRISDREGECWLDDGDIKRFPRHDLRIINQLWVKYSGGKFGFSVQKRIWQDVKEDYKRFGDRVGWLVNLVDSEWRRYDDFIFSSDTAPEGHFPSTVRVVGLGYRSVGKLPHRLKLFLSRY